MISRWAGSCSHSITSCSFEREIEMKPWIAQNNFMNNYFVRISLASGTVSKNDTCLNMIHKAAEYKVPSKPNFKSHLLNSSWDLSQISQNWIQIHVLTMSASLLFFIIDDSSLTALRDSKASIGYTRKYRVIWVFIYLLTAFCILFSGEVGISEQGAQQSCFTSHILKN